MQYLSDQYCMMLSSHCVVLLLSFQLHDGWRTVRLRVGKHRKIFCHTSRFFFYTKNKFFCVKIIVLFVFMIFVSIITISSFVQFILGLSANPIIIWKDPFTVLFIIIPPVSSHILSLFSSVKPLPLSKTHQKIMPAGSVTYSAFCKPKKG